MHLHRANAAVLALTTALGLSACGSRTAPDAAGPAPQTVRVVTGSGNPTQLTTLRGTSGVTGSYDVDIDRAWRALPSVYDMVGIPIANRNDAARTLGNPGFMVRRRLEGVPLVNYLDCGRAQGAPSAETYEINLAVRTQLTAANDGRTTVSTYLEAMARPVSFAGEFTACATTGALERRIVDLLVREAGKQP